MTTQTAGVSAVSGGGNAAQYLRIMGALLARDVRVLRRDITSFLVRTITQPVLFVFVFSFVLPKIGSSGGSPFAGGASHGPAYSTVLVPGMVASALMIQGLFAVTTPLVMELSYTREIEDRVLAPQPVWLLGVEKIVAGAIQAVFAALIVFPFVMLIHAKGQSPKVSFSHWLLLAVVIVTSAVLTSALGLLMGTIIDPRRLGTIFGVILVPMTMLGCVYYPWQQLHVLRWLQYVILANPLVYISEALRAALTPGMPHMPTWVLLLVLIGGAGLAVAGSVLAFARRLID